MHLVGYLYEEYHDARSLEHKIRRTQLIRHVYGKSDLHVNWTSSVILDNKSSGRNSPWFSTHWFSISGCGIFWKINDVLQTYGHLKRIIYMFWRWRHPYDGARSALDTSELVSTVPCVLRTPSAPPFRMIPAVDQVPGTEAKAVSPAYLTWMSVTPTGW